MLKLSLAGGLALACLAAGAARADTVAALVGDDTIVLIDTQTKTAAPPVKLSGISGTVLGIDVRPADGLLYALVSDGAIVTVDPKSGKASAKSKLNTMLPAGAAATVDFNPMADRLRVIGTDGTNLRANVDDGKVTTDKPLVFAESDAMKGKTPKVIAGAYTNSVKGTKETALYDIDASGSLLKQAPPNDGVLNTIGAHGVTGESIAFDIAPEAGGGNSAWLISGSKVFKIDLATGKATEATALEGLKGTIRDIAVLPAN